MHHHQHDARLDDAGQAAAIGTDVLDTHSHDGHRDHAGLPGAVVHEDHAHDRHAGHSAAMFRRKFWISLALTIPILIWGHMLAALIGYAPPALPGSMWIAPIFGTAVFAYGGWPFVTGAMGELRDRLPGMMTLIALAIGVAFLFSAAVTFGYPGKPLWEELATLVTVMLLGHWLEMSSVSQARGALGEVSELREGDLVLVRPGVRVPADGVVRSGESDVDESVITGESVPVKKVPGDKVIAGSVNATGSLRVEVTGVGERTALAGIMSLVAKAQSSRSRVQALADRAAFWLTCIALGVGAATFVAWLLAGAGASAAIEHLVTVLVIACPHALGLAVPLVIAISTTLGARSGLLVRDRRGLEDARNIDTVVFDKTGTLTLGEFRVLAMRTVDGVSDNDALRLAAAVERDAEHPIARAIVATAADRGITVPAAQAFEVNPGRGARATVDGRRFAVGGPNLLAAAGVSPSVEFERFADEAATHAQSIVYLVERDRVLAAFAVADAVRAESADAVRQLQQSGIEVVMMT
ncbi:MAG: HAD family hydrolase, partial [Betaproteobacteria bacterium]